MYDTSPLKILGVDSENIRRIAEGNYAIPVLLNRPLDGLYAELLTEAWRNPGPHGLTYTSRHQAGVLQANAGQAKVTFKDTTVEMVRDVHAAQLTQTIEYVNRRVPEIIREREAEAAAKKAKAEAEQLRVEELARDIKF